MSSTDPGAFAGKQRNVHDEDEELALPPLDGALDEHADPVDDDDDGSVAEEAWEEGDGAPIDIDPGWAIDELDEIGAGDAEAAHDAIDVGSLADVVRVSDDGEAESDEQGLARDHEETSPFDAAFDAEGGAGTSDDPSAFVDESALPPLDMDDDERAPGRDARPQLARLAVARGRFSAAAGLGVQVPCWLVAVSPAGVVAAGPSILIARDGAHLSRGAAPEVDAVALAANDEAIFAVARRDGALFATMDGGDSWTAGGAPWPANEGPLAIAATPGRLWVCEGGALWSIRWSKKARPGAPVPVRREGVRSIVAAGSTLVALVERGPDLVLERLRADDEATPAEVVPAEVRAAIGDAEPVLAAAAAGRVIGLHVGGAVLVSRDAGRSFDRFETGPAVALAFSGAGEDARPIALLAIAERGRDPHLVLAEGGRSGEPAFASVADLPAGAPPGRGALAWDASREVVWVACPSGLVAFERSARH